LNRFRYSGIEQTGDNTSAYLTPYNNGNKILTMEWEWVHGYDVS
jgi:hypothetical protein